MKVWAALRAFIACFASLVFLYLPPANAADNEVAASCAALSGVRLPGATVIGADFVEAGAFRTSEGKSVPKQDAFCRVVGRATPSSDSDIRFELWLPAAEWNGRLWGGGNFGFAGSIGRGSLLARMNAGYAAVNTDTGHQDPDTTTWAIGHPQKVIDFGHRGIHEAAVNAKRIVAAFYGRPTEHAYFSSCSTGGQQALMEVQRYPEDYDGVIAGATLPDWISVYVSGAEWQFKYLADKTRHIPEAKLPAIRAAVMATCDSMDGVKDGVIDDPRQCTFDPKTLACSGAETDQCLTAPQVDTLQHLYAGLKSSSGKQLMPGYAKGSEDGLNALYFRAGPGSDTLFPDALDFWRGFVFEDPKWDFNTFDADRDGQLAQQKLGSVLNATNSDLSKFASRGGKLILWHGWADPGLPPAETLDYYRSVQSTMGAEQASKVVRLFMLPGVSHCGGGDGPNRFGVIPMVGNGDPQSDIGAALQRWVEKGVAPERIVATKVKDGSGNPGEVVRTRPLCAYPKVARYTGTGNTDLAANFECRMP